MLDPHLTASENTWQHAASLRRTAMKRLFALLVLLSNCQAQDINCPIINESGNGGQGGGDTTNNDVLTIPSCDMPYAFTNSTDCQVPTCCEKTMIELNSACAMANQSMPTALACTKAPKQSGINCVDTPGVIHCLNDGTPRVINCCGLLNN